MGNLTHNTIFVTGASSGIGEACAKQFAEQDARLIIAARRRDRLEKLASQLKKDFDTETFLMTLDVRDRASVEETIHALPKEWQAVDVLLNNAGLAAGFATFQEGSVDDWEHMIDTNVKGLLYVTKAMLPFMIERNQGHIINIGSIAGHEVYPNGAVYCATKHAVNAINRGLKMDLLGKNIRVTSIDPGAAQTEFSEVRFAGDTEKARKVYEGMTPLSANDIADAVLYCATRPAHVNISEMIVMPTDQSGATLIHRK